MEAYLQGEFQKAVQYEQQGNLPLAKKCYEDILVSNPMHELGLHALALVLARMGDIKAAREYLEKVISVNPQSASAYSNLGNCYTEMGDLEKAKQCFEKALEIDPQLADAHFNLGNTLSSINKHEDAIRSYTIALSLNPSFADCYFNMANSLAFLGRYKEALDYYQKVESVLGNNPKFCLNIGCAYFGTRKLKLAIDWISRATQLKETYPEAYNELGRLYSVLGNDQGSIPFYLKAIEQDPHEQTYLYNISLIYMRLGNFSSANHYAQKLKPSPKRLSLVHYLKSILCDWDNLEKLNKNILSGEFTDMLSSWDFFRITDSAELQYKFASDNMHRNFPKNLSLGLGFSTNQNPKIKIGYFSPDFRNHAVMHLSKEIFLNHDRNHFEVHAFSMYPNHTLEEKNNLKTYFDYLHEINDLSDNQVVEMSRHLGLDIAVDLSGNTRDSRTGIFALRAAPVQVNYLGYTGTMGVDYYDYIIADSVIIPPAHQAFYSEKIVYLKSFMPRQVKLVPSSKPTSRAMYGLPPEGFVFCCFNKSFKFNPEVFESWLNILKSVPMSVLWFNGLHDETIENLKKFTRDRNIDPSRLIFSTPVADVSEYLSRHRLAGLFLDTYPYNAHTTASDALWSGLPVLTRIGNSFASRVAASLLTALDLPELITHSIKDYENLAIALANNPKLLSELKKKLKNNIKSKRLFDMKEYMREYEKVFTVMHQRVKLGQLPSVIDVNSI